MLNIGLHLLLSHVYDHFFNSSDKLDVYSQLIFFNAKLLLFRFNKGFLI